MKCNLCPRNCNTERLERCGVCGTHGIVLSRIGKHFWEEPCISGDVGSGTVFFAGCNLKCRFCQNFDISAKAHGVEVSPERLADVFLYLQDDGVANINLVTPSHVSDGVARALELAKPQLHVPVVYNTSSYEKVQAIRNLDGLVDVYLPDLKFCSPQISRRLCGAQDYFEVATHAIDEMMRQQPQNVFDGTYLKRGVLIRHLVLPSFVEDTKLVLDWIVKNYPSALVSVMSQYFPAHTDDKFPQLNRRLYNHEYQNAVNYFFNVGLKNGFMQDAESAIKDYVPNFDDGETQQILLQVPHRFAN